MLAVAAATLLDPPPSATQAGCRRRAGSRRARRVRGVVSLGKVARGRHRLDVTNRMFEAMAPARGGALPIRPVLAQRAHAQLHDPHGYKVREWAIGC